MTIVAGGSTTADLLNAVAALLWVVLAAGALVLVARTTLRTGTLLKLSIGPTGVSMEFADQKLREALESANSATTAQVGSAARRTVIDRLQQHAAQLRAARILWVDDHPENNGPIVELLRRYGAAVDTPRTSPHLACYPPRGTAS